MSIMTPSEFQTIFDDFEHQLFRLETLDFYDSEVEREPLKRFRAGIPQVKGWREPWVRKIQGINARGATIDRVHVVTEPLNEYLRFELTAGYPGNVQAGEGVRIMTRPEAEKLGVPNEDYWLFDDERTAIMVYDDSGKWKHVEVTDDPETVRRHVHWREVTRANSIPVFDYLASIGLEPDLENTAPATVEEGK